MIIQGAKLNPSLISALVERWRPETHTFHLPSGEATITLQDVAYQLGLPVEGHAITGKAGDNWFLLGRELLGVDLVDLDGGRVLITWLDEHFTDLSNNASIQLKEQFAHAHILRVIGGILMPDKSRNKVDLMWLCHLRVLSDVGKFSWGSTFVWTPYDDTEITMCSTTNFPRGEQIYARPQNRPPTRRAQPAAPRRRRGNNIGEPSTAPPQPQPPVADSSTPIAPHVFSAFQHMGSPSKGFFTNIVHLYMPMYGTPTPTPLRPHCRWRRIPISGSSLIHHHRAYSIPVVLVGQVLARVRLEGLLLETMMRTTNPLKKKNLYLDEIQIGIVVHQDVILVVIDIIRLF
ncbi:hypothetical protein GQ457_13G020870 [Hibiscus cannabinus]